MNSDQTTSKPTGSKYGIFFWVILVLILEVAISGFCTVTSAKNAEAQKVMPDQVLTAMDLKEVLGQDFTVEKTPDTTNKNFNQCMFKSGKSTIRVGVIQAVPKNGNLQDSPEAVFANLKTSMAGAAKIEGVGQDNLVAGNQLLVVLQSGRLVAISNESANAANAKTVLADLGKRAVQNMNLSTYPIAN
jgi:hypothetical protein